MKKPVDIERLEDVYRYFMRLKPASKEIDMQYQKKQ